MLCELDGIAHKIQQNLPQPCQISFTPPHQLPGDVLQGDIVLAGPLLEKGKHFIDHRMEENGQALQLQPLRLQLGKIKQIIEQL